MIHSFDTDAAKAYGLSESIILSNIEFWISKNKANSRHFYDGKTWTYNSVKAFEDLFPYLTIKQIRRCIDRLVEFKVIVKGNYNENTYDRTSWFALTDEYIHHLGQIDLTKKATPFALQGKSTNTDSKPDTQLDSFEEVYQTYPKKVAKPSCLRAWKAAKVKADEVKIILDDIEKRKQSVEWLKDGGQFIPHPSTYFNQRRWEDRENECIASGVREKFV